MTDVKPCIRRKGVFMFTDSFSRQKCQIADDHGMLYEREKLIETYLNLDKRIRPLISFVLYFCQTQNIKRVDDGDKFLSTYPLIILVLNFLMSGLEYPVIPSLQKLSVDNECNIEDCLFTKNKGIVVTKRYRQYLNEMKFWYHTCVIIKHDNDNMDIQMENKTVWNSHNNDSLGALLIAFFQYYANQNNLTGGVSIFHAGKRGYINLKTPIAIQDPFLPINNISSSCKQDAMEQTIKKFDSAWKALMDEKSLQFICEYKLQLY
ncbi:uncharacterized protein EV154DRAFT_565764 [Mucor mucedo]|uniref:uncharacterized protein n=1 Tax=Mucor mucedo TaxID=29922 RepID=UPI00221F1A07|nr:uncharacterized protein EV154DRAFT_565764 [Mucor mucedo]KAI7889117.1 hypothetical protein EV154DRAFT_565764 [Mucor mucedo]